MVTLEKTLIDGALFAILMSALIVLSLLINPRVWLQDYPEEIRKLAPPLTASEKRLQWIILAPFLVGIFVVPFLMAREVAGAGFLTVFGYLFVVLNVFNLFDAVVLDTLLLGFMRPKFALIPEAWDHPELLSLRREAINWIKGVVFCTVGALIIALAVSLTTG